MIVHKIIADSRPSCCLTCPVARQQKGKCGQMVKKKEGERIYQFRAPDHRCIIEITQTK